MSKQRVLTGRHVLAIFGTGFGIVIAVNLLLATKAVQTFPGLEVKNSYVASQTFDAERAAQEALDWDVSARLDGDRLILRFDGPDGPVAPEITHAVLGRTTERVDDRDLDLVFDGTAFAADVPGLGAGKWDLRLKAEAADGTRFRQSLILYRSGS
ncbi:MAG: FixH family protein [Marinibacterium sp.]